NFQFLPEFQVSLRERFGAVAKDQVTRVEKQANLHLPAPLRVELCPPVDGFVGPSHPQFGPDAPVAIRSSDTAGLIARCRSRVPRTVRIDNRYFHAHRCQVVCRPASEGAGAHHNHIRCCFAGSGSLEQWCDRDRLQEISTIRAHGKDMLPLTPLKREETTRGTRGTRGTRNGYLSCASCASCGSFPFPWSGVPRFIAPGVPCRFQQCR